jgi:hypothetical protein
LEVVLLFCWSCWPLYEAADEEDEEEEGGMIIPLLAAM